MPIRFVLCSGYGVKATRVPRVTTEQSVHGQTASPAGSVFLHRFGRVLGTTGEETAAAPEHGADRISIEGQQRQQQLFHRITGLLTSSCGAKPRSLVPRLVGPEVVAGPPDASPSRMSEGGREEVGNVP